MQDVKDTCYMSKFAQDITSECTMELRHQFWSWLVVAELLPTVA